VVALVLTGMVNYSELNVGDPLAFVFHKLDLDVKYCCSKCCNSDGECFIGFPNGSTAYMDEYES
jgi:hypothetical protein